MLESIEHQITAVKAMLAAAGNASADIATHKVHQRAEPKSDLYMSENEDDEIERQMAELIAEESRAKQSEKFLGEILAGAKPTMRE